MLDVMLFCFSVIDLFFLSPSLFFFFSPFPLSSLSFPFLFITKKQSVQSYVEENGLLFMETSAKTAQNVNELFVEIGFFLFLYTIPALLSFLFTPSLFSLSFFLLSFHLL